MIRAGGGLPAEMHADGVARFGAAQVREAARHLADVRDLLLGGALPRKVIALRLALCMCSRTTFATHPLMGERMLSAYFPLDVTR